MIAQKRKAERDDRPKKGKAMFSFVKSEEEGNVFLCKKSRMLSRMFSIVKKEKEGSRESFEWAERES